jgi:hypothetical protein
MHYGKFVLVLYLSFVGLMGLLVYKSVNQSCDLVTPNYYVKELAFQKEIRAKESANAMSVDLKVEVREGQVLIFFPEEFKGQPLTGNVLIYCPWEAKNDKVIPFAVEKADSVLSLPCPVLKKGKYEFIVDWEANGTSFLVKEAIFL